MILEPGCENVGCAIAQRVGDEHHRPHVLLAEEVVGVLGRKREALASLSKALTRFRLAWHWNGGPAILQSRATDDTGYVQPPRNQLIAERGVGRTIYHFNGISSWAVTETGEIKHVYT